MSPMVYNELVCILWTDVAHMSCFFEAAVLAAGGVNVATARNKVALSSATCNLHSVSVGGPPTSIPT